MDEFDLVELLKLKKLHISFVESCTGGMLAERIINVPSASNIINESYVTYSCDAKHKILGVKYETIEKYNVVSTNVAEEMVEGLIKISEADVGISVTGLAGPDDDYPILAGTVCFGFYYLGKIESIKVIFKDKDRNEVRKCASDYALDYVYNLIKNNE